MKININYTASHPSLSPMLQCHYMLQEDGMMMVMVITVMTSSSFEVANGETWVHSPEEEGFTHYQLSISMTSLNTVIIELN